MIALQKRNQKLLQFKLKKVKNKKFQILLKQHRSTKNKNKLSLQLHKFDGQLRREENQLGTQSTSWREMSHTVY
ncbi:isoeugenol synthase 1-like [Fagus crenata]